MAKSVTKSAPIKFSVPLPPKIHLAVAIASATQGQSNSTLIAKLVERRFSVSGNRAPLRMLAAGDGEAGWKRVSVFLPPWLKDRATQEVQRQHGDAEDKRRSGSLAAAIAALVAEEYAPRRKRSANA